MNKLQQAIQEGKHIKFVNLLRSNSMSQRAILINLGLEKFNSVNIRRLLRAGLQDLHGYVEIVGEDKPTFQASFHDLILDDGSITVGDIYPQIKRTKFKSKYQAL